MVALPLGLGRWLRSPVIRYSDSATPDSLLRSDRTALFLAAGGVTLIGVGLAGTVAWYAYYHQIYIPGLGVIRPVGPLRGAVSLGVAVGGIAAVLTFFGSGSAWLSYTIARWWLALLGRLPWRLQRFLREAHAANVLRQAGAAYQVRHDLVRNHLLRTAARAPDTGVHTADVPPTVRSDQGRRPAARGRQVLRLVASGAAFALLVGAALVIDPRMPPVATLDHTREFEFSPDGRTLAVVGTDGVVRLWNTATHQLFATLNGGEDFRPLFASDGHTLATVVSDDGLMRGLIRLWDTNTGNVTATIPRGSEFSFSSDRQALATVTGDGFIRVWTTTSTGMHAVTLNGKNYHPNFSPDGHKLMTVNSKLLMRLWDTTTGQPLSTPYYRFKEPPQFSPDGTAIYAPLNTLPDGAVQSDINDELPQFSPDGRILAIPRPDASVQLWSISSPSRPIATLNPDLEISQVLFSPDSRLLATVSSQGALQLYTSTGGFLATLERGRTSNPQFSPDGHTLAVVKEDDVVRLWNVDTGVPAALLKELPNSQYIWFISDDRTLVDDGDGIMRLWSTATGTLVTALPHDSYFEEISPDGRVLATATTRNGLVQLWNSRTGMLIATLDRISDQSLPQFSPDGRTVGIINMDDTLLLWSVPRP